MLGQKPENHIDIAFGHEGIVQLRGRLQDQLHNRENILPVERSVFELDAQRPVPEKRSEILHDCVRDDEQNGFRIACVRAMLQTIRNKDHLIFFKHIFPVVHGRTVTPALYVLKFQIAVKMHGHIIVELSPFQTDMRVHVRF